MQKHYQNKSRAVLIFSCLLFNSILSVPQEIVADYTAQLIEKNQGPVVIMIYADYCGACKTAKKELSYITKQVGNKVSFYMCNVQDPFGMAFLKNHTILEREVNSIPVFIIRNKGKLAYFQQGYPGKENLIQKIQALC
ncbi:thioredoxin family protein [Candidatus Babeliales bacterium]|nr:thioredoxin family protein [Candidatus Babeliales bacterium]